MAKIERKYLAHFMNTAKQGLDGVYERLGKDLEEFQAEMSAQVERKVNILGEQSIVISGYEKSASVDTYYAQSGTALFDRLQEIVDKNLVLEDLKADIVEVKLWEASEDGAYPAIREAVYLEVNGYGGDNTGYQIPFTIHYTGEKTPGKFNLTSRTFTEI